MEKVPLQSYTATLLYSDKGARPDGIQINVLTLYVLEWTKRAIKMKSFV